jgi:hypothetical protein
MSAKFINCTPHDIVLYDNNRNVIHTFPKTGVDARLLSDPQRGLPFQHTGVPVFSPQRFEAVLMNGPADALPVVGSFVIVSLPVGEYYMRKPAAYWVFGPDTGPEGVVRDQRGQIMGTKRLVFYAAPAGTRHQCPDCGVIQPRAGECTDCKSFIPEDAYYIENTGLRLLGDTLIREKPKVDETIEEAAAKKAKIDID